MLNVPAAMMGPPESSNSSAPFALPTTSNPLLPNSQWSDSTWWPIFRHSHRVIKCFQPKCFNSEYGCNFFRLERTMCRSHSQQLPAFDNYHSVTYFMLFYCRLGFIFAPMVQRPRTLVFALSFSSLYRCVTFDNMEALGFFLFAFTKKIIPCL